jgi:hypothetical protein
MSQPPVSVPPEVDERCATCGAPLSGPVEAVSAPRRPSAAQTAPAGTHCEWCGAEFPDEADA